LTRACVLCFGIVVADRIYEVEDLPQGEGKYTAHAYREGGGGIAGTAAVAVAALGARALFCGAVGEDQAGLFLRAELAGLGVDLGGDASGARRTDAERERGCGRTGRAVPGGGPRHGVPRGPDPALLAQADAVLVDHRFPDAAAALLRALPPHVPGVLDAEGGDAADLRRLAALAAYPVFSCNGLKVATGAADPEQGLRVVDAPVAAAVGVTLGEEGSLWRLAGSIHRVPAPQVRVRDTTGCGDVFHGAFALALAEEMPLLTAARFASAVAALKARRGEGWHGMPDRTEAEALMRAVDANG